MNRREQFIHDILEINPKYDVDIINKAFRLADDMHKDQLRKSGEPYIVHPIAVSLILAELGMDEETIVAGLLHDVVEDTPYTNEQLKEDFGEDVMILVDGVTKLGSITYENKEKRQAENLRKMFLAMSKDIRVLIIKLADRLHNLRTINYMTKAKIEEKCTESLEVYAPLAARLGMYTMKFEMEDICLKYLHPESYYDLVEQMSIKKAERQEVIDKVIAEVRTALESYQFENFEIKGRSKHFYSIYKKMKQQNKQLEEIFDLTAIRVIVDSVKDCYAVLGIVHTMWKPIPGKFKDYIAMPKPNGYQSLHTTVIGDNGRPFEIQIRTYEMHKIAEFGIAAHWKYKEGISQDKEENKLAWLRHTLEIQKDLEDPKEFMDQLKVDLFASQVYVFTPRGDVMELPAGSTPLDFAFKIHTDVGCKCVGAKINGKIVTIDHELQNGDIIEILTNPNSVGPNIDWLRIAKSSTARTKIRQFLKKQDRSDSVDKGKNAIDKYMRKKGYEPNEILKSTYINKAIKELKYHSLDDFYTQISQGGAVLGKAANIIITFYKEDKEKEKDKEKNDVANILTESKFPQNKQKKREKDLGISVKGLPDLLVRTSKCCNPVPGDEIVGYITKGRGVSVHRADCPNIASLPDSEKQRFIEVEWDVADSNVSYDADISIIAEDRKGLFSDLSRTCEDMDVNIIGVNFRSNREDVIHIVMTLSLTNTGEIQKTLRTLKNVRGVIEVYRAN